LKKRVILVEINEVTWDLIDPLIEKGLLPTFARLKREGTWAVPMSVDLPPQLDPWITWTTVYTGRRQKDHNVFFLQQPPESIKAKRIWEVCAEAGLGVGVYGSLCSWPPKARGLTTNC
jgi:predicted AlkP superfamily phosphohydrolase/phosphomutase